MRTCHDLKCNILFYEDVESGQKPFEVRANDRDYKVGDHLWLREGDLHPVSNADYDWRYTGKTCVKEVTYVLTNAMFYGVRKGYVVLGLKQVIA